MQREAEPVVEITPVAQHHCLELDVEIAQLPDHRGHFAHRHLPWDDHAPDVGQCTEVAHGLAVKTTSAGTQVQGPRQAPSGQEYHQCGIRNDVAVRLDAVGFLDDLPNQRDLLLRVGVVVERQEDAPALGMHRGDGFAQVADV